MGYIGIAGQQVAILRRVARFHRLDQKFGVLVARFKPDGSSATAGLRNSDVLLAFDGQPVSGIDDLLRRLSEETVGRALAVTALRGVELLSLDLTPTGRPAN